ncbi:IS66 family insertion sequence element accessory protein TnpA [Paenibacillus sp. PL2-23]|uniref:IS66 family insertion sequence element accessory protein TnpA n=1 Tax=Paenibacillus sp. PL2-23 TaxID=2100729 RepID=UPI0040468C43
MRNRYRLQQWTELIRDCRSSGQTVVRWCADHEVSVKSYYYWLKKIHENEPSLVPFPSSLRMSLRLKFIRMRLPLFSNRRFTSCSMVGGHLKGRSAERESRRLRLNMLGAWFWSK